MRQKLETETAWLWNERLRVKIKKKWNKFTNETELAAWHHTFLKIDAFAQFGERKFMPKFKRRLRNFNDVRPSLIYHIWPLVTPYQTNLQMTAIAVSHWAHLYELDESTVIFVSSLQCLWTRRHTHTHTNTFGKWRRERERNIHIQPKTTTKKFTHKNVFCWDDPFFSALETYFTFWSNDAAGMQWILFHLEFITD